MELTRGEIERLNAHRKTLGLPARDIIQVRVTPAPGASREAVMAEMLRVEEAIAAGDSLAIASIDEGTIDWPASFRSLRDMGWGRLRAARHLFRKWRARRKNGEPIGRSSAMTEPTPGTVIHGTLRAEDLIPAFLAELQRLDESPNEPLVKEAEAWVEGREFYEAEYPGEDYDAMGSELVNILQDALNDLSPDKMYFGSHEGDGSDFGWWPVETDEDAPDE